MESLFSRFGKRYQAPQPDRISTLAVPRTVIKRSKRKMKRQLLILLAAGCCTLSFAVEGNTQTMRANSLNEKQASHFAGLAMKCVAREYPNKPEHVVNNSADVRSPKSLHPAFYGCYDWHSSVHGH